MKINKHKLRNKWLTLRQNRGIKQTKTTFILVDFSLKLFPKASLSLASHGRDWKTAIVHSSYTQQVWSFDMIF